MGGLRTPTNDEVSTARSLVALAGRLAGVPVLDMVVSDFADDGRYTAEAAEARALGYAGKLCIHPNQVALANQAFTPSGAEIDRARRLIDAFEAGVAAGFGVVSFEGQMIDEPLVRQARRVLRLAV
jgi:citrate lyase subunit beta/citryl-CoA lyase